MKKSKIEFGSLYVSKLLLRAKPEAASGLASTVKAGLEVLGPLMVVRLSS